MNGKNLYQNVCKHGKHVYGHFEEESGGAE